MPRDKSFNHTKVIKASRQEFLEKGFAAASMRSIAAKADMSVAGLYRHFADKEDMFLAIVSPLMEEMNNWLHDHISDKNAKLANGEQGDALYSGSIAQLVKDVIYPKREEFKLLLNGAKGSRYENFMHDYVEKAQGEMLMAFKKLEECNFKVTIPEKEELHVLLSAYMTALFEPILHDYTEEKMENCLKTVEKFFAPGWKEIMGI